MPPPPIRTTSTASKPGSVAPSSLKPGTTSGKVGQAVGTCIPQGGHRISRMGNGASSSAHVTIDGETYDMAKLKVLIPDLQKQVADKTMRISQMNSELVEKDRQLKERDEDIKRLKAEVDKLKSVLELKVTDAALPGRPDILSTITEDSQFLGVPSDNRTKRQGVSAESPSSNQNAIELKHVDKDFR